MSEKDAMITSGAKTKFMTPQVLSFCPYTALFLDCVAMAMQSKNALSKHKNPAT